MAGLEKEKMSRAILLGLSLLLISASDLEIRSLRLMALTQNWERLAEKLTENKSDSFTANAPLLDFLFGYSFLKINEPGKALLPLERAGKAHSPVRNYGLYYLGKSLNELGDLSQAESYLNSVSADNYVYLPAQLQLLKIYLNSSRLKDAKEKISLIKTLTIPQSLIPELVYLEAKLYQAEENPALFQEKLLELWINYPDSSPALELKPDFEIKPEQILLRAPNLISAGLYQTAIQELNQLKKELKNLPIESQAEIFSLLAHSYFQARNYQAVIALEKEGEKYAQHQPKFWFYLGWAYHRLDKNERAIKIYRECWEKFKPSPYALLAIYNLAQLEQSQANLGKAIRYYEELIEEFPEDSLSEDAGFKAGLCYFRKGKYEKAIEIFEQWLQKAKNPERFQYWLARSYQELGEEQFAENLKKELLKQSPISGYAYLIEPEPDFGSFSIQNRSKPNLKIPAELQLGLSLAQLGLVQLAGVEIDYQLAKKPVSKELLAGLIERLIQAQAYPLAISLYWSRLAPLLSAEEINGYLYILYPTGFSELVEKTAEKYQVESALAYSLIRAESAFNPSATSKAGAIGLTQVMPGLAKEILKKAGLNSVDPMLYYEPNLNLNLGLYHLSTLLARYRYYGSDPWPVLLPISAYNAGRTPTEKWFKDASEKGIEPDLWIELIPYSETQKYLKRVLGGLRAYRLLVNNQTLTLTK